MKDLMLLIWYKFANFVIESDKPGVAWIWRL